MQSNSWSFWESKEKSIWSICIIKFWELFMNILKWYTQLCFEMGTSKNGNGLTVTLTDFVFISYLNTCCCRRGTRGVVSENVCVEKNIFVMKKILIV